VRIVVDEDIPFAAEAFARFGAVRPLAAHDFSAAALRDADALIVRSVTRVNAALLEGTSIRFVGTATSGVDHIDLAYLRTQAIAFADALGANANAVAEYVVAALLYLRAARGFDRAQATLGIVGCGHVGRQVARYAAALGLRCVITDPPLGRATCEPLYRPMQEALACDLVSLHVPLERTGPDPTWHLVNDAFLGAMKPGAVLINTSRGAVADSAALKRALDSNRLAGLILDVWENEPAIDVDLADGCLLATAHIAGHSLDAKIAAVGMLVDAFAAHTNSRETWTGPEKAAADPVACDSLESAVRAAFDIRAADRRLRDTFALPPSDRAAAFDALRAGWPARREFHVRPVSFEPGDPNEMNLIRTLGFRTAALAGGASR
jgi:erythronate-4-phosphate dehydrogenase